MEMPRCPLGPGRMPHGQRTGHGGSSPTCSPGRRLPPRWLPSGARRSPVPRARPALRWRWERPRWAAAPASPGGGAGRRGRGRQGHTPTGAVPSRYRPLAAPRSPLRPRRRPHGPRAALSAPSAARTDFISRAKPWIRPYSCSDPAPRPPRRRLVRTLHGPAPGGPLPPPPLPGGCDPFSAPPA